MHALRALDQRLYIGVKTEPREHEVVSLAVLMTFRYQVELIRLFHKSLVPLTLFVDSDAEDIIACIEESLEIGLGGQVGLGSFEG